MGNGYLGGSAEAPPYVGDKYSTASLRRSCLARRVETEQKVCNHARWEQAVTLDDVTSPTWKTTTCCCWRICKSGDNAKSENNELGLLEQNNSTGKLKDASRASDIDVTGEGLVLNNNENEKIHNNSNTTS
jgi:hypothetical protein